MVNDVQLDTHGTCIKQIHVAIIVK